MSAELEPRLGEGRTKPSIKTWLVKACLLVCIGSLWTLLEGTAQAATIEGTVRFTGTIVEPKVLTVTSDRYVCGEYKDAQDLIVSADQGISNAVVSLLMPPSGVRWYPSAPPPQIDQEKCVFIPRLVIVPVGGTMEFLNSDRLLHNIRSRNIRHNRAFNRTQPRGRTIPITFTKPEIVQVGCDLHPWMRSWLVVADHPFYTITGDDGEFTLGNVPPGQYTLVVWQEMLGTVTTEITVVGEGVTKLTIEMN